MVMRGVGYIYIDEVKNIRSLFLYDEKVIESIVKALGGDIDSILTSITKPPAGLYMRVNLLRASREMVIDMIEREGYRAYRDAVLDEAIYIPIEGPYKVTLRDKVVVADKRASESVMMGSNLYAPGVISCGDVRKGDDVTVVSENGIILANGKALMDCKDAMRIKRGIFVEVLESLYRAAPLRELSVWREGLVYPQSLPSMVASKLLNPEAHEVIIDMCAAPGGKTGHLIELSKGMATIYAIDHSASRIQEMMEHLERLGHMGRAAILRLDARYLSKDLTHVRPDKIILDPPCSSTGVRPKIWHKFTWKDLESIVRYQRQLLEEASRILKNKGLLVYSTCSITYDENQGLVNEMVNRGIFEVVEPPSWVKKIARISSLGTITFDPRDKHPGFFIAILKKTS